MTREGTQIWGQKESGTAQAVVLGAVLTQFCCQGVFSSGLFEGPGLF